MGKSKTKGELHVKSVYAALYDYLLNKDISHYQKSVKETVQFIVKRYSNIKKVQMKYEFEKSDFETDLKLTLVNGEILNINLFTLDRGGKIQPKNPGANSFLETYFQLPEMQKVFNAYREIEYKNFLQQVISTKEKVALYDDIKQLKQKVNRLYPKFTEEINPLRRMFLFNLREYLFELLNNQKESLDKCLEGAFSKLLLLNDINIVTSNAQSENVKVEQWHPSINFNEPIELYRKGNDTLGIRKGKDALTLRIKFESSPSKSLKLATSYDDLFPEETSVRTINVNSLKKFKKAISNRYDDPKKNDSNAVGKCNEAIVYSAIVETFPAIYQVEDTEYINMYTQYAPLVKEETRSYLIKSANASMNAINKYLNRKYESFVFDSIQLVPDSYIKDRLDTTDLKLTIKIDGKTIDEDFSLKAITTRGSSITVKNPGVGTILGPTYFDCGSTDEIIDVTKSSYKFGQITREESLENVSRYIGEQLKNASQESLLKGLQAMLGKATTIVTFYLQEQSEYYERHEIEGQINVYPSDPTPKKTKLTWNDGNEYITLRVKFSSGEQHGWSSLKLAAEYKVR